MPTASTSFNLESSGTPDILPAFGSSGGTWNDTAQAVRLRMNIMGDKDGTANGVARTVNVSSGYTGNILVAQFVGVQTRRPRNLVSPTAVSYVVCSQSATTLNAVTYCAVSMVNGTGIGVTALLNSPVTGSTALATTATNRMVINNTGNSLVMREPGYLVFEVGIRITASTTAGTVSFYFGSANAGLVANNESGTTTTLSPVLTISPDLFAVDTTSAQLFRAEQFMSANIGS